MIPFKDINWNQSRVENEARIAKARAEQAARIAKGRAEQWASIRKLARFYAVRLLAAIALISASWYGYRTFIAPDYFWIPAMSFDLKAEESRFHADPAVALAAYYYARAHCDLTEEQQYFYKTLVNTALQRDRQTLNSATFHGEPIKVVAERWAAHPRYASAKEQCADLDETKEHGLRVYGAQFIVE